MLVKIIGAIAGERIAKSSGMTGTSGALLGAGAATVLRRLGPIGFIAAAAGGYALKKYLDKHPVSPAQPTQPGYS